MDHKVSIIPAAIGAARQQDQVHVGVSRHAANDSGVDAAFECRAEEVTWDQAVAFAADAGGELPTRREQALLFANLKDQFEEDWYWSGEQHASSPSDAWIQTFNFGGQDTGHESYEGRARAVRRLPI